MYTMAVFNGSSYYPFADFFFGKADIPVMLIELMRGPIALLMLSLELETEIASRLLLILK